jgi:indole-3-pyruvate monooxygenase
MATDEAQQAGDCLRAAGVTGAVIVGAGPSGLAAAACLAARGVPATVLEMSDSLMSTWRHRTYDRLTLHLPRRFCELPLLPFPEDFPTYPSKDQFVAYMEAYAAAAWVMRLAGGGENVLMARWLVVAAGENAGARLPRRAAVCGARNAHVRVQVRGGVRGGEGAGRGLRHGG